jgi:hypothetical protein
VGLRHLKEKPPEALRPPDGFFSVFGYFFVKNTFNFHNA